MDTITTKGAAMTLDADTRETHDRELDGLRAHAETCHEDGHVRGCPGKAGGDHEAAEQAEKENQR
jgi:hypothetical protein